MSLLDALLRNPSLTLQHRNIFLLSHMRANTSLFGHLIGSHEQVEGYYEMHIGYYSWKSLWRQKLLHFRQHKAKPKARWMFDKVLHDGHYVAPEILSRAQSKTIFMLRAPAQSVRSLVVLFRKHRPDLPEATPEGATRYYVDRLNSLNRIAGEIQRPYFYLDAENLIADAASTLNDLSTWLELDSPIPTEYETFNQTGAGDSGDHSARLKSGKINQSKTDYSDIVLTPEQLEAARLAYESCRSQLILGSERHSIIS